MAVNPDGSVTVGRYGPYEPDPNDPEILAYQSRLGEKGLLPPEGGNRERPPISTPPIGMVGSKPSGGFGPNRDPVSGGWLWSAEELHQSNVSGGQPNTLLIKFKGGKPPMVTTTGPRLTDSQALQMAQQRYRR